MAGRQGEDAFRSMQGQLGLRPVNHSLEDRCRAHIWITVLAYRLQRWTEHSLKLVGYKCTWRRLKRSLETHCHATVIMPAAQGLEHHNRKLGRPDRIQKLVCTLLGIVCKALPVRRRTYRISRCAETQCQRIRNMLRPSCLHFVSAEVGLGITPVGF